MTVWLIENERGECFGYNKHGKITSVQQVWTTPDFAIRFARREDAEIMSELLMLKVCFSFSRITLRNSYSRKILRQF
jgi:hypothetical protein